MSLHAFRTEQFATNFSRLGNLLLSGLLITGVAVMPAGCDGDDSDSSEDESSNDESSEDESSDDESSEDEPSEDGPSEDEPSEDEPSEDEPSEDEPSEDEPSEEDPSEEDPSEEDPSKEEAPKRDCDKINWGTGSIKAGSIVPRDDQKGFLDADGDNALEAEETDVGMCQLHETGRKCGLIISGFKGWGACAGGFRRVASAKAQLLEAGFAIYASYTGYDLATGKSKIVDGFLSGFANIYSNKTGIRFPFAPHTTVIDLRTMEVIASGQVTPQQAISKCKALAD